MNVWCWPSVGATNPRFAAAWRGVCVLVFASEALFVPPRLVDDDIVIPDLKAFELWASARLARMNISAIRAIGIAMPVIGSIQFRPAAVSPFEIDASTQLKSTEGRIVRLRVSFEQSLLGVQEDAARRLCTSLEDANSRFLVSRDPAKVYTVSQSTQVGWTAVETGPRRYDYQIPPTTPQSGAGKTAKNMIDIIEKTVVEPFRKQFELPEVKSRAFCFSKPRCKDQEFHADNFDVGQAYYTLLVPLTTDPRSGGTQFELGLITYPPTRGTAYCFDGAILHRGLGNKSSENRAFAAFVLSGNGVVDPNTVR